jgi:tripartite-type tricarboxylate transporter receptor subunit TctC
MRSRIGLVVAVAATLTSLVSAAHSTDFPTRPIHLIVPFPAGGTSDIVARTFARQMEQQLGQSVIVDNRGGADGVIGTQAVAQADPDGYTLMHNSSSFTINASLYKNLQYDIFKDFIPIANVAIGQGYLMVVNANVPALNVSEFIEYAKKNRVLYGSPGHGNPLQLAAALFNANTGTNMEPIPFRGTAPAVNALLAGDIQVMFMPPATVLAFIEAKKLRAIAFTGNVPPKELPDVPLMKSVLPSLKIPVSWHGWFAPANTPPEIINKLATELLKTLESPAVLEGIRRSGYEAYPKGSADFAALLKEDAAQVADELKAAKIESQ